MKQQFKVPKGWRKLRDNECTRDGDRYAWNYNTSWKQTRPEKNHPSRPLSAVRKTFGDTFDYYRKIKKK